MFFLILSVMSSWKMYDIVDIDYQVIYWDNNIPYMHVYSNTVYTYRCTHMHVCTMNIIFYIYNDTFHSIFGMTE